MKRKTDPGYLTIETKDIADYVESMTEQGLSHVTVRKYDRELRKLYRSLGPDKRLRPRDFTSYLIRIRELHGYSNSTINSVISAYNGFARFLGYPEFCINQLPEELKETPELSSQDYYTLLLTAKRAQDRRAYLLILLFGNTTLRVHDMACVTVDAVERGILYPEEGETIRLPEVLQQELLSYAADEQIAAGAILRTGSGRPLDRSRVTTIVSGIGENAGFPEGMVTPRSLHKFYMSRLHDIRVWHEMIIEQEYARMLETEQSIVGWAQL